MLIRNSQPLPMCEACNKPVDKIDWDYRDDLCITTFIAYCHGEIEKTQIPDELLHKISTGRLEPGVAFKKSIRVEFHNKQKQIERAKL